MIDWGHLSRIQYTHLIKYHHLILYQDPNHQLNTSWKHYF